MHHQQSSPQRHRRRSPSPSPCPRERRYKILAIKKRDRNSPRQNKISPISKKIKENPREETLQTPPQDHLRSPSPRRDRRRRGSPAFCNEDEPHNQFSAEILVTDYPRGWRSLPLWARTTTLPTLTSIYKILMLSLTTVASMAQ